MPLVFHPSLEKILMGPKKWLERENSKSELDNLEQSLIELLNAPGSLSNKVGIKLEDLAHYYGMAACDALVTADVINLTKYLRWSVRFNAVFFRLSGMYSDQRQDLGNWPQQYWDSLKAAGPIMLSDWNEAKICAVRFIEMAEKDQRINSVRGSRCIKQGTNDVFLIYLFSQAFDLKTSFAPPMPLIAEYQHVLDSWWTSDESEFKSRLSYQS
jgi:hypothetical protein